MICSMESLDLKELKVISPIKSSTYSIKDNITVTGLEEYIKG